MEKIIVGDVNNQYKALLTCFDNSTFSVAWEKNNSYEISFTALDDGSLGYSLLKGWAYVWTLGQQWTITASDVTVGPQQITNQITATHIGLSCTNVRTSATKTKGSYTPLEVLSHYFDGNKFGYTYEVIGKFSAASVDSLEKGSGKDCLDKIIELWPTAVIFPDNKKIRVYADDKWGTQTNFVYRLGRDTDQVELNVDPTDVVNVVTANGKTLYDSEYSKFKKTTNEQRDKDIKSTKKPYTAQLSAMSKTYRQQRAKLKTDDDKDALKKSYEAKRKPISDELNKKTVTIRKTASTAIANKLVALKSDPANFTSYVYRDEDSIKLWGERPGADVSIKNETDTTKLRDKAVSAVSPDPSVELTVDYHGENAINPGDIWFLDASQQIGLQTSVMVAGFTFYPNDRSQATQVTLNNRKKTMMDVNLSLAKATTKALGLASDSFSDLANAKVPYSDNDDGSTTVGGLGYEYRGESNYG